MPVMEYEEQVCGIIENSVAEKAVGHGLGAERVAEYMQEDFSTVTEDEDLYRIMEIILGERQRLVPVLRGQEMVGVITRTDLINLLVQEPARFPDSLFPGKRQEKNIQHLLRERLPADMLELLRLAGRTGREMGMDVYAVGGFVAVLGPALEVPEARSIAPEELDLKEKTMPYMEKAEEIKEVPISTTSGRSWSRTWSSSSCPECPRTPTTDRKSVV